MDEYDWIAFLPMADGSGSCNRYFGRLGMDKMKIQDLTASKEDTHEYVRRMQQELFEVLGEARSLKVLQRIEPKAREVRRRYMDELGEADVRELAIHRRVSRMNYSRRCAEASAVQAYVKQGMPLAPGMEIGYMVKDAGKWEVKPERTAKEFDSGYYRKLLEKSREEVALPRRAIYVIDSPSKESIYS